MFSLFVSDQLPLLNSPLGYPGQLPVAARGCFRSTIHELSKKHRHFYFHFIPTSSSWLNQVERFFALITEGMIRRGTFRSVEELERAIYAWLANWNNKSQPFVWEATADVILDKVRRCKELAGTPH
jgi:transposase